MQCGQHNSHPCCATGRPKPCCDASQSWRRARHASHVHVAIKVYRKQGVPSQCPGGQCGATLQSAANGNGLAAEPD
eukprot:3528233-Lingulodinium_polyedra.AAC.1